ncbi:MAG: hypothetical protein ABSD99_04045, partial [Candidatus Bathyarchaeia archaeon]
NPADVYTTLLVTCYATISSVIFVNTLSSDTLKLWHSGWSAEFVTLFGAVLAIKYWDMWKDPHKRLRGLGVWLLLIVPFLLWVFVHFIEHSQ